MAYVLFFFFLAMVAIGFSFTDDDIVGIKMAWLVGWLVAENGSLLLLLRFDFLTSLWENNG